jgi:hypothetical protein
MEFSSGMEKLEKGRLGMIWILPIELSFSAQLIVAMFLNVET